ncbi:MAG: NAD(P)H-dependent oxidoreductase subunit E [Cyanobacteriota bacterium]
MVQGLLARGVAGGLWWSPRTLPPPPPAPFRSLQASSDSDGSKGLEQAIARLIRQQGGRGDALIEVLHRVQELEGYLSPASLRQVARGLGLPLSRVLGVASFYHLFRLEPPTPHRCAVCLGTACFVKGGADLARALERQLGVRLDDGAGNGIWALQHVSCVGACSQAPVLVVDGAMQTRLPVDEPEALLQRFAAAGLPGSGTAADQEPW